MKSVALAYPGVHQIFQLALAASEMGELDGLYCSLVEGERRWGRRLRHFVPTATRKPLGLESLPPEAISEFPWPLLANRLMGRMLPKRRTDYNRSSRWFDQQAAKWLSDRPARIFVGGETCALESFGRAKEMGMRTVLDCPGFPAQALDGEIRKVSSRFGVDFAAGLDSRVMVERKRQELALADLVLCSSSLQRECLLHLNPSISRAEVVPLWTDVDYWNPAAALRKSPPPGERLRVLYAGAISLPKGVPYLLEAVEPLAGEVSLTLVGRVSNEMGTLLSRFRRHQHLAYVPKVQLRDLFARHDVFVMPSLGDSFGFVILEAMAAGLPVVASRHAGAPVPTDSWRVPPHDPHAIRERLLAYYADRELLHADAAIAFEFAGGFRPSRYRASVALLLKQLLAR